jgi:hypothetical protein
MVILQSPCGHLQRIEWESSVASPEIARPFSTQGFSRERGGWAPAKHELPNQESADRHPLFYISKI